MIAFNLMYNLRDDCKDAGFWILTSAMSYLTNPAWHQRDGEGSTVESYFPEVVR